MFFLLRIAFWLCVVCLLLPSGKTRSGDAQIDATQAVTLASAAVTDVTGFCDRQPDACKVGGKVAIAIGQKAEAGARTLYEIVTTKIQEGSAPARTAAPTEKSLGAIERDMTGILRGADFAPAWHTPVPLPRSRPSV